MRQYIWKKATLNLQTYAYLRRFVREAMLPAEEVRKTQFNRMKALRCNVSENHQYYRERFDASRFYPFNCAYLHDFRIARTWDERAYMLGKQMRVMVMNGYHWRDVPKEGMEYILEFVENIPSDPSGKIRMLISKVSPI